MAAELPVADEENRQEKVGGAVRRAGDRDRRTTDENAVPISSRASLEVRLRVAAAKNRVRDRGWHLAKRRGSAQPSAEHRARYREAERGGTAGLASDPHYRQDAA